jgi:putative serine protease PepD
MLLAALVGAGAATAAVVAIDPAGSGHASTRPSVSSTAVPSNGAAREVSNTGLSATQIYKQDSPGVVAIEAKTASGGDKGTGIVLNDEGLILTNDHVVQGATSLQVTVDGSAAKTRSATLVGEEANSDLALIKVDPSGLGLKALKLASASGVRIGDQVFAIGNPYGLEETLTKGIVSALNREISAPDGAKITAVIQTDAALNPGNSGGPLLNNEGEVIGVNSQIASDAAQVEGSQPGSTGVGFAISTNTIASAVRAIEAGKGVTYAAATRAQAGREAEAAGGALGGSNPYEGRGGNGPEVEATEAEGPANGRVVIVP